MSMVHLDLRLRTRSRVARLVGPRALLAEFMRDPVVRASLMIVLLSLGAFMLLSRQMDGRRLRSQKELADARGRATVLAAEMARDSAFRAEEVRLSASVGAVRGLDLRGRYAWPQLMDGISRAIVGNVWLTSLSMDGFDPSSGSFDFRLRGSGPSVEMVGSFGSRLLRVPVVRDVKVSGSAAVRIASFPMVRFEIQGHAGTEPGDPGYGGSGSSFGTSSVPVRAGQDPGEGAPVSDSIPAGR